MVSEAHLSPADRTVGIVHYLRTRKRRSRWGWALFVGFIILNEMRGLYVVAEFLKALAA